MGGETNCEMSRTVRGWKKVLYIRQPNYPDNYVDKKLFLAELKKNVSVKLYTYPQLVWSSTWIIQQVAVVIIFMVFFHLIHINLIPLGWLLWLANSVSVTFYVAWLWQVRRERDDNKKRAGKQSGKSGVLFLMTLLGLTPVLKTLTEDVSSDSIWILTATCLLLNLLFYDYTVTGPSVGDSLSLNAAIFASVMLASRLPSKPHVFGLVSLAVDWFALFPLIRRILRARSELLDRCITGLLILLTISLLNLVSSRLTILFIFFVLWVMFGLTAFYVYLQGYKNQIHGPWDEASVRINKK